ncbi:hypothetical protein BGX38DRAFT_1256962 [Terfezia claveryi]|nr:hypothetical protein BGX38DRAFT_1256962 [Terfezia claveryi]
MKATPLVTLGLHQITLQTSVSVVREAKDSQQWLTNLKRTHRSSLAGTGLSVKSTGGGSFDSTIVISLKLGLAYWSWLMIEHALPIDKTRGDPHVNIHRAWYYYYDITQMRSRYDVPQINAMYSFILTHKQSDAMLNIRSDVL